MQRRAELLSRCRGFVKVIVHSKVIVQMQKFSRGAKVPQSLCRGTEVQWCRGGAEVKSSEVQRCSGAVMQRCQCGVWRC